MKMAKLHDLLPDSLKIPAIGLGTSKVPNEEDLEQAIDVALKIGYRHIDTASVYKNEHVIGRVLKKWLDGGKLQRNELFVVSKLPFICQGPGEVSTFVEKSLKDLQLDYVDLYLIHFPVLVKQKLPHETKWDTFPTDHLALWKKLEDEVDAGRIKALGVSNFNAQQIQRIVDSRPKHPLVNLQIELHVFLQQTSLVDFCHKNGISVTAYAPLGSPGYNAHLIRTGRKPTIVPDILNNKTIAEISRKYDKTTAQIVLRYLLHKNIIVIPKSATPKRLEENFDLNSFNLDPADMASLATLDMGESGRIFTFKDFIGLSDNPEWPFVK